MRTFACLALLAATAWPGIVSVLDPDGKPIKRVRFSYRFRNERGGAAGPCVVKALPNGTYDVAPKRIQALGEQGLYLLTLRAGEWGSKRLVWQPGAAEPLVVKMRRPAVVIATVVGAVGSPHLPHLGVVVQEAEVPDEQRGAFTKLSPHGRVRVAGMQPVSHELLLGVRLKRAKPGIALFWTIARAQVELSSGPNRVQIKLPALHKLTIRGEPGRRHYIQPADQTGDVYIHYLELDENGEFTFDRLPAGKYHITGLKDGKSTKLPFTIPAKGPLVLPNGFR